MKRAALVFLLLSFAACADLPTDTALPPTLDPKAQFDVVDEALLQWDFEWTVTNLSDFAGDLNSSVFLGQTATGRLTFDPAVPAGYTWDYGARYDFLTGQFTMEITVGDYTFIQDLGNPYWGMAHITITDDQPDFMTGFYDDFHVQAHTTTVGPLPTGFPGGDPWDQMHLRLSAMSELPSMLVEGVDLPAVPPLLSNATSTNYVQVFMMGSEGMPHYFSIQGPLSTFVVHDAQTKDDCKNGGWEQYGFKNQGQCVRYIETGKDSR